MASWRSAEVRLECTVGSQLPWAPLNGVFGSSSGLGSHDRWGSRKTEKSRRGRLRHSRESHNSMHSHLCLPQSPLCGEGGLCRDLWVPARNLSSVREGGSSSSSSTRPGRPGFLGPRLADDRPRAGRPWLWMPPLLVARSWQCAPGVKCASHPWRHQAGPQPWQETLGAVTPV